MKSNQNFATREWVSSMITKSLKGFNKSPDGYVLPAASESSLGGVIVDGVTTKISGGILRAISNYKLPTSSKNTLGGVKIDGDTITIDSDGTIHAKGGGGGGGGESTTYTISSVSTGDNDASINVRYNDTDHIFKYQDIAKQSQTINGELVLLYNSSTYFWVITSAVDGIQDDTKTYSANEEIKSWRYNVTVTPFTLKGLNKSGTNVEANPEGEATDVLNKIKIGEEIYSIPEGSGSSKETLLTKGQISNTSSYMEAALSKEIDVSKHKLLTFEVEVDGNKYYTEKLVSEAVDSTFTLLSERNITVKLTSTSIRATQYGGDYKNIYCTIYAYDLESSGSKQHEYSTEEQLVGKWFGENLYERVIFGTTLGASVIQNILTFSETDIKELIKAEILYIKGTTDSTFGSSASARLGTTNNNSYLYLQHYVSQYANGEFAVLLSYTKN